MSVFISEVTSSNECILYALSREIIKSYMGDEYIAEFVFSFGWVYYCGVTIEKRKELLASGVKFMVFSVWVWKMSKERVIQLPLL